MSVTEPPLDREAVAAALSTMAFQTIDPDRSLNLDCGIFGDEAQSLLERTCRLYGVDVDLFWSKVEFARYFDAETNALLIPVWFLLWIASLFWTVGKRDDGREPFTVDLLVRRLEQCRSERDARSVESGPRPPSP